MKLRAFLLAIILLLILGPGCASTKDASRPEIQILTKLKYNNILFEVIWFGAGKPPNADDLEYLCKRTARYTQKDSVKYVIDRPLTPDKLQTILWNHFFLEQLEESNAKYRTIGDTLVIHILYVPGFLQDSMTAVGLAYSDFSFVLFEHEGIIYRERSTLLHEFGHLMGLVRCNDDLLHKDPEHNLHCKSENCVMYWVSIGGEKPDFDRKCKEDIRSNGGK